MKITWWIIALILIMQSFAAASRQNEHSDDSPLSKLDYDLSIQPGLDKTVDFYGSLRYTYSEILSSRFFLERKEFKEKRDIDGVPGSILNEDSSTLTADVYFLEYNARLLPGLIFYGGIAFDYISQTTEEKGRFDIGTGNNDYQNKVEVSFYSPKIECELKYLSDLFNVKYRFEVIPLYYFDFSQTTLIDPLVSLKPTSNSYDDTGSPYNKN